MDRATTAKIRKGIRIYHHPFRRDGQVVHSENYTYRVKRLGKTYYFNVGSEKKAASKMADEIAAYLAVKANTIENAIARFSPEKVLKTAEVQTIRATVEDMIERYVSVTNRLSHTTVRDNCSALRRIAAVIHGLPANQKKMTKAGLVEWRVKVGSVFLD